MGGWALASEGYGLEFCVLSRNPRPWKISRRPTKLLHVQACICYSWGASQNMCICYVRVDLPFPLKWLGKPEKMSSMDVCGAPDQGLVILRKFFNKNCNVSVPSNKCHVLLSAWSFNLCYCHYWACSRSLRQFGLIHFTKAKQTRLIKNKISFCY